MAGVMIVAVDNSAPIVVAIADQFRRAGIEVQFPPPGDISAPDWLPEMERRIAHASTGVLIASHADLVRNNGVGYHFGLLRGYGCPTVLMLPKEDKALHLEHRLDRVEIRYVDFGRQRAADPVSRPAPTPAPAAVAARPARLRRAG